MDSGLLGDRTVSCKMKMKKSIPLALSGSFYIAKPSSKCCFSTFYVFYLVCVLLSAHLKLISEFHLENVLSIRACLVIFATDLDGTTST